MFFLLFFLFFFLQRTSAVQYPSKFYNRNELLLILNISVVPTTITIGSDSLVIYHPGDFAFLATSFDKLSVDPPPDLVPVRTPYDDIIETPPPFDIDIVTYIANDNRLVHGRIKLEDVHTGGSVFVIEAGFETISIYRVYAPRFPAFDIQPFHQYIDTPAPSYAIWCPVITPAPPSFTFHAAISISSLEVDTFELDCPLASSSYILTPAPLSYQINYTLFIESTVIARGTYNLTRSSSSFIPPLPPPLTIIPPVIPPLTILTLEPDQVLPRFSDSPAAFVGVTLDRPIANVSRWLIEINNEVFVADGPRHVFAAQFATDYTVRLIPVPYIITAPARLYQAPSITLRIIYPIRAMCDSTYKVTVDPLGDFYATTSSLTVTTNGHTETFDLNPLPPPIVCDDDDDNNISASPAVINIFTANIDIAPVWHEGLTDEQICLGMVMVQFLITSTINRPLSFELVPGVLIPVGPQGNITLPLELEKAREISQLCIYIDGGARLLACPSVVSTLDNLQFPVDFVPARVVSISPYRSPGSPGRINIGANLTDYKGQGVDPQRLVPGVYLATTTRRIPTYDTSRPVVMCVARELITVPLATSPFASIKPRLSESVSLCPRNGGGSPTPFQIAADSRQNPMMIWNEEEMSAIPFVSGMSKGPGRYQLVDVDFGEYSSIFELRESPYSTDDFKFSRLDMGVGISYPPSIPVTINVADCHPYSLDLATYNRECPDNFVIETVRPGYAIIKNLPFVDLLIVEFTVLNRCAFQKRTQYLPVSTGLPTSGGISSLRYKPECDGSFTVTPMYVDPYSMKERPIDHIPYAVYRGWIEGGGFRETSANVLVSQYIPQDVIVVHYSVSKDGESVYRNETFTVFHPPHFEPRVVNPVFCPGMADARVVFDNVNFDGIIQDIPVSVIKSKGITGLGAGTYVFKYETVDGCKGEKSMHIVEKLHYDIEARIVAKSGFAESSLLLRPGGEFDVITADMVKPDVRKYIQDSGSGTREVTGLPNGFGISIDIPYPESYSHIREDFCPTPVVLTAGLRTFIPLVKITLDDDDNTENDNDYDLPKCTIQSQKLPFGTTSSAIDIFNTPYEVDGGNTFVYHLDNGCMASIEWVLDTTNINTNTKSDSKKRRAVGPGRATLSRITCTISTPLSCPFCSDAEITVTTDAYGPVIYAWTDIPVTSTPVRTGLEAGAYFLTVIEQGSDVDYAPFCIVSVAYTGPSVTIEGLDVSFPRGCYSCARVDVTINAPGATSYALLDAEDPPIDSCFDGRLTEYTSMFTIMVRTGTYIPYVCDGASIIVGDEFVYTPAPPGPMPPVLESVVNAELCVLEEGGYAIATPAQIRLINVTGGTGVGPRAWVLTGEAFTGEMGEDDIYVLTLTERVEAGTVTVKDARECRLFVYVDVIINEEVSGVCGTCGGGNTSCLGCDGVAYSGLVEDVCGVCGGTNACNFDCLIPSNETVPDAIEEITWCVANNRKVTGNLAPFINETVVLPASSTLDMQFLQFEGLVAQSDLGFLLNVDITQNSTVRSPIATFSSGTLSGVMTLPGDVNIDGLSPNQQMNLQFCVIDGLVTVLPPGGNTLFLNWAYMQVGTTRVAVNRTGATLQFLTTTVASLELFLDSKGRRLAFSTNGGSTIESLVVFIPGGWVNVSANNTDVNGTRIPPYWQIVSSNETLQVVCYYLTTYPTLIKSGRGWYGGPVLNGTDTCFEFGGGGTPSQSPSMSHFKYEPAPFPDELRVLFILIGVVGSITLVLLLFLYMKW